MNFSITLLTGRKRKRCGTCENCFAVECGTCKYCLDKPKFGGNGVLRQSCINKKCHNMTSTSQGEYVQVSREFDCITEQKFDESKAKKPKSDIIVNGILFGTYFLSTNILYLQSLHIWLHPIQLL